MSPIINNLLEVKEGDVRSMDLYITGLLQPITKPYADLNDDYKKVHFAVPESDVRELIKSILNANYKHIEMMKIAYP